MRAQKSSTSSASYSSMNLGQPTSSNTNPYNVDFVLPFDISIAKGDRVKAREEVGQGYLALLTALESAGGLQVASKVPKGKRGEQEVWIFVSATEDKVKELVDMERWVPSEVPNLHAVLIVACWMPHTTYHHTPSRLFPPQQRGSVWYTLYL